MAPNDIVLPSVSKRHPIVIVTTTAARVCEHADPEPPRCLDVGSESDIARALLHSSSPSYGSISRWSILRNPCGRKSRQSSVLGGQCCAVPGAGLALARGRQTRLLETVNRLIKRGTERVPLGGVPFGGALLGRDDISRGQELVQEGCATEEDGSLQLEPRKFKKVLILMSDTGGGHRASAEALKATFKLEFGDEYKVTIIDLWQEYTPWPFNQVPKTYSFMVKHEALWKLAYHSTSPRFVHQSQMAATSTFIARYYPGRACFSDLFKVREVTKGLLKYQPDVIVSVHPLMQHVPLRILRAKGLLNKIPFTTVITDLSTCHPTWFHRSVTKCFCPTKDIERRALKAGLRPSQLRVYGLPIRPAFSQATHSKAQLRKELELIDDLPSVLLMGGGEGMGPVEATAHALLESLYDKKSRKPIGQLVVICGRNKKLVDKLESFDWAIPVKIQGFVTNMADWMGACDCVITKAGPGTIAEAMICGLPMVLNSYIAGQLKCYEMKQSDCWRPTSLDSKKAEKTLAQMQEVGNVSYVVDNAAGKFSDKPTEIACIVAEWFGSKAVEFKEMAQNAAKLGRPDAVFKIVHDIDELARTRRTLEDHKFAYL